MTFARSITLPPPTATITSGSCSRPSATAASTAERGTSTTASLKTVTSRPLASDSTTVAKPGVPAIDRVGDDEHAAAVAGGDAAGGRGHPGAEQHLRGRAQDGEVGHRSVSRKVVSSRLNSSVRSSGDAWPQRPKTCAADVGQQLEQRQEAVAQRHDRGPARRARAARARRSRPAPRASATGRRPSAGAAPGTARGTAAGRAIAVRRASTASASPRRASKLISSSSARAASRLGSIAPQRVEPGGQRHRMAHRADRDHARDRARARARERRARSPRPPSCPRPRTTRDPERVDQRRAPAPSTPRAASPAGAGSAPNPSRSGAITRWCGASAAISGAHAAAVVPGPEPCSSSTGGPEPSASIGRTLRPGRRRARARS